MDTLSTVKRLGNFGKDVYTWKKASQKQRGNRSIKFNQIAFESLAEVFNWYITIQLVCVDAAYRGELKDWLYFAHQCQLRLHVS